MVAVSGQMLRMKMDMVGLVGMDEMNSYIA